MSETQVPYCEPFKAWLKTERKEMPPCGACADACSRRRRARELRAQADAFDASADRRIKEEHP